MPIRPGHPSAVEFVHRTWPATPAALRRIRRDLSGWLVGLGLVPDLVDDVVLAVDEAAANAVRHAYPPDAPGDVGLTMWTEPDESGAEALCVEIADHGAWQRAPQTVFAGGRGGRGMLLMQRMVETVLVHHDRRGTRVLLRQRLGPAQAAAMSAGR